MNRVLVVCSVHRETGNATAGELCWVLEHFRPDVIFLEQSPENFAAFLNGDHSLESAAVRTYRGRHRVELQPVDLPPPGAELKPKIDALFDWIESASPRYRELSERHRYHTWRSGLAYLNSSLGAALAREMQQEMQIMVERLGDARIIDLYSLWTQIHDARETEIIRNILAFAKNAPFDTGVLIVGSAHRQGLIEKSELLSRNSPATMVWEFDWELPAPNDDAE